MPRAKKTPNPLGIRKQGKEPASEPKKKTAGRWERLKVRYKASSVARKAALQHVELLSRAEPLLERAEAEIKRLSALSGNLAARRKGISRQQLGTDAFLDSWFESIGRMQTEIATLKFKLEKAIERQNRAHLELKEAISERTENKDAKAWNISGKTGTLVVRLVDSAQDFEALEAAIRKSANKIQGVV